MQCCTEYIGRCYEDAAVVSYWQDRLTNLSVVRLKVLQHLFLLHDFVLGLIQLDPEDTHAVSLAPSIGEHGHSFYNSNFIQELTHYSHLHVCIKFPLQV